MNTKRVADVFLFPTGMLAVCDANGEQIGELQGSYSIDLHKRIKLEALDECKFNGFDILPYGFNTAVCNWLQVFGNQNLSWDEIKSL